MHEKNYTGLIPPEGEGRTITASAKKKLDDEESAKSYYEKVKHRLLNVNGWHDIAGTMSAEFQLTDAEGNEVQREVDKGDHFRVAIKGPGSTAGEGYDWVRVEDVKEVHEENVDSVAVRVKPTTNPNTPDENIAHFYAEKSTSTFVVTRESKKVYAEIYDRNIEANEETDQPTDKIRNAVVGLTAKYGASKLQWQALADGLVEGDTEE